jgi:hypothetical protein
MQTAVLILMYTIVSDLNIVNLLTHWHILMAVKCDRIVYLQYNGRFTRKDVLCKVLRHLIWSINFVYFE